MGYHTDFDGSIKLSRKLTVEEFNTLNEFADERHSPTDCPGVWCQWIPNDTATEIEFDGGEKFYNYCEWMTHIVNKFLIPWGVVGNGVIRWVGEDSDDCGALIVDNNYVTWNGMDLSKVDENNPTIKKEMVPIHVMVEVCAYIDADIIKHAQKNEINQNHIDAIAKAVAINGEATGMLRSGETNLCGDKEYDNPFAYGEYESVLLDSAKLDSSTIDISPVDGNQFKDGQGE